MPTSPLGAHGLAVPRPTVSRVGAEWWLVAANAASLSRGVLALSVFVAYLAGGSSSLVLVLLCATWATDLVDGRLAQIGWKFGAKPRPDGQALDPLMDDLGFVFGFLMLADIGLIPIWFLGALLTSRFMFALIRIMGGLRNESFAKPMLITKLCTATLGSGQIVLTWTWADPTALTSVHLVQDAVLGVMCVLLAASTFRFVIQRHGRRTFYRLLVP